MKIAFSSNAYTKFSLSDSIAEIARIGYNGIEILCDIPHAFPLPLSENKIKEIKMDLKNYGIEISNLNAFTLFAVQDTYHPSWIEENPGFRKIRVDHTINCLKLASLLGAKNISVEPGGPVNNDFNRESYLKIFKDGIDKALPVAEKEKVKILVEPEPNLLIENSDEFLQFIKDFDSAYIGLNFDIGHFVCVNEDPSKLVSRLSEYIHHFHLADIKNRVHNHLIPGIGSIDFKEVIKAINDTGYDGFITVELYPYKDNPSDAALQSYNYIMDLLKSA
jgi:sugar phosphate isomerase/epimerase